MDSNITAAIRAAALTHSLDPLMVEAVVMQESGGDPWAWNPEPKYRYFWDVKAKKPFRLVTPQEIASKVPPRDFPTLAGDRDQEWWAQQASFGLCQLMGSVARELGCASPYLTVLCDPVVSLHYGCRLLAKQFAWADHNWAKALSAYNGGRGAAMQSPFPNREYPESVLARYQALKVR